MNIRPKRRNGDGTVVRRSDGRWQAALRFERPDGTFDRTYFYGKDEKEARKKLEAFQRNLAKHGPLADDRVTVEQFLHQWLEEVVRPRRSPATYESYEMHARINIIPVVGHLRLNRLTPRHVDAVMNRMQDRELSPRSVAYARAVLRIALNVAMKWELVTRNVAKLTDAPTYRRPEVRPLSVEDAAAFLSAIEHHRLAPLFTFTLATGLRQAEILGLRSQDVDLDASVPVIHVRYALDKIDGKWRFVEPKTERSRRTVALSPIAVAALRQQEEQLRLERLVAVDWEDWGLVFPSSRGTPLDGSNVTHTLQRLLKKASLPRQRFHDLRHFAASVMVAEGVPMRVVMEVLGHSQMTLTSDTYAHIELKHKVAAAATIDEAFSRTRA